MSTQEPDVIVTGGGPAGMMAAFLLARAGVTVTVLEKHADFFRDFRGDTVHPSTMQILDELGLLERFLQRPHNRIESAEMAWDGRSFTIGDLTHLKMSAPFIAMMPQWDFLDFLRDEATSLPNFDLRMRAEVASIIEDENGRVVGVRLADGDQLRARRLVLMCDGRTSLARSRLPIVSLGAPIDIFWFAVPKRQQGRKLRFAVRAGRLVVMIDRGDYWQCALVIAKGSAEAVRERGIDAFRNDLCQVGLDPAEVEEALPDFDAVRLLSVSLDRLERWHQPGLLAIGDAAHAMSPVGGIGINLAIQDAVCTANILAIPLSERRNVDGLLPQVQERRLLPTRLIQGAQAAVHRNVLQPLLSTNGDLPSEPPLPVRLLDRFPVLRRIPGYLIGHGVRMEHVRSPNFVRRST